MNLYFPVLTKLIHYPKGGLNNSDKIHLDIKTQELYPLNLILQSKGLDQVFLDCPEKSYKIFLRSDFSHPWGKINILAWNPGIIISQLNDHTLILVGNTSETREKAAFPILIPEILNSFRLALKSSMNSKFSLSDEDWQIIDRYVGLYGYLGYEFGGYLEKFQIPNFSELIPAASLYIPLNYIIETAREWIYIEFEGNLTEYNFAPVECPSIPEEYTKKHVPWCNKSYQSYIKAIDQILHHIIEGDIYQTNFTINFALPKPQQKPDLLFHNFFQHHPTPYAAYLHYNTFDICSHSMELFLNVEDGLVITRPIKGTRPRGKTNESDQLLKQELDTSAKDHAELAMIVDLLRNDLSRSCIPATIQVRDHAKIESFSNVHHLISTIEAKIEQTPAASWRALLRSFPGGSITGCPKMRAMEIIGKEELLPRGIYTGSIGLISLNGTLKMNIAIRTLLIAHDTVMFNAGGGITFDSKPDEEYLECMYKIIHFVKELGGELTGHLMWKNGIILSLAEYSEFERQRAIYNKQGCFETILIQEGRAKRYQSHLSRFITGCDYFELKPTIPSIDTIAHFCRINLAGTARLRISCFRYQGSQETHTIMEVSPFQIDSTPVSLFLGNKPFEPPAEVQAAGIKTLQYSGYQQAMQNAFAKGAWDTILFDQQDLLLETGRSNIYFYMNSEWVTPAASVIKGTIRAHLLAAGIVSGRTLNKNCLVTAQIIAVSNALNGVRAVHEIRDNLNATIWKQANPPFAKEKIDELNRIIEQRTNNGSA